MPLPLSTLKLVGDRFQLTERQGTAVIRSACRDQAFQTRPTGERLPADVAGESLWIDGFNLLTTIEAAFAGGVILGGRDGCDRDMASMHGNYRRVDETRPALSLIGDVLEQFGAASCRWYLDRAGRPAFERRGLPGGILTTTTTDGIVHWSTRPPPHLRPAVFNRTSLRSVMLNTTNDLDPDSLTSGGTTIGGRSPR